MVTPPRWLRAWLLSSLAAVSTFATSLSPIRVNSGGHYLETADGKPFFWLGDTAWALFHATTREETSHYLQTRADHGYNVIQAVVLAEFNGVGKPSALGQFAFVDNDPTKPNDKYFDRVVEVVDEAATRGL